MWTVVLTTFVGTTFPTKVVGTTVHTNSLKIGQIRKPCQSILMGNEQKNIIGIHMPTFTEC